jgi:hypothetical protein
LGNRSCACALSIGSIVSQEAWKRNTHKQKHRREVSVEPVHLFSVKLDRRNVVCVRAKGKACEKHT